jgi:hypothetical protein
VGFNEGDAGKASTASAVAEAKRETGFVEPPSVLDASIGRASEPQDDDSPPSAEDLARISEDPQQKALYRKLVRESHQTGERLSAQHKEAEQAMAAVNAIREDPKAAARMLAQASGMRVKYEDDPVAVADRVMSHLEKTIGREAAEALGPVLLESVRTIAGDMVAPFHQEREERQVAENRAAIQSQVTTFANSITEAGGDYDIGIERDMAALVASVPPGPRADAQGYMKILYNEVMSRRGAGKRPARGAAGVVKAGMNPREAVRVAVAQARRDLGR